MAIVEGIKMKSIKMEVPKVKVAEIKLTNDDTMTLQVQTYLYDSSDNYLGYISLSNKSTSDNTLTASQEIVDLISDLFLKVEQKIVEKDSITFTGK